MVKCGLLGEKLGHSYSPVIHGMLADYEYKLYEKSPEEVADFVRNGDYHGLNVTIPYKKTVIPLCDEVSEMASAIGSVNTLVRRPDGTLFGDNTDAFGFEMLVRSVGVDVTGKKAVVLGTGGASVTVCAVLKHMGAGEVVTISRNGENNYDNLNRHADAELLVNATPVGTFPKNGFMAADPGDFPNLKAVYDVVYNPRRTAFLLRAEELGIPYGNGLLMLVAQAKRACEIFTGTPIDDAEIGRIEGILAQSMQNLAIIGMPGSGKTTIARLLAAKTGRPVKDADAWVVEHAGKPIPEIFAQSGEEVFRQWEADALSELGKQSGTIIATGGGCVTRERNYALLHQNSIIIRITRDLARLPKAGRPISQSTDLQTLFEKRDPMYSRFADITVSNDGTPEETVQKILDSLSAYMG